MSFLFDIQLLFLYIQPIYVLPDIGGKTGSGVSDCDPSGKSLGVNHSNTTRTAKEIYHEDST